MTLFLLLVGLGLLVLGADWLVDGASAIARRAGENEFVIGLTIVGFGTSCPELMVSLTGAIQGNADIAIGNIVGSNIFNIILVLGCSSIITPLAFTGKKCHIDRWEGAVMLLLFAGYYHYLFKNNYL